MVKQGWLVNFFQRQTVYPLPQRAFAVIALILERAHGSLCFWSMHIEF
jgi:hypothetical protein